MRHTEAMIAEPENCKGRLMVYLDVTFPIQHLKIALHNYHETVVHLPSLRPGLAEDLSIWTRRVSNLEGGYVRQVRSTMLVFDPANPAINWIDPKVFRPKSNSLPGSGPSQQNLTLTKKDELSESNFIFLNLAAFIERVCALVDDALPLTDKYHGSWTDKYFEKRGRNDKLRRENANKNLI